MHASQAAAGPKDERILQQQTPTRRPTRCEYTPSLKWGSTYHLFDSITSPPKNTIHTSPHAETDAKPDAETDERPQAATGEQARH